jgi:hypothetical protein
MPNKRSQPPTIFPAIQMIWPSDDLLGEIQATLAALADLECSFEQDQERLRHGSTMDETGQHLQAEREKRHQREREPYVQHLSQLEQRMRTSTSSI